MMQNLWSSNKLFKLVFFIGLLGCSESAEEQLPYYFSPDFTPHWASDQNFDTLQKHQIPNFQFTDQHGEMYQSTADSGHIKLVNFFFTTCPGICLKMTQNLLQLQPKLREDPQLVIQSFTVTPWIDSVPRLAEYASFQGISANNWHLLTGNQAEIYQLARQSFFAEKTLGFTKDSTDFLHTEHILLIDKNNFIRGIYNGTIELEISRIKEDIALLKAEASQH